jgi:hypothetical protein
MTPTSPVQETAAPPDSKFDYSRPLSGNLGLYKLLWRASRVAGANNPKPHLLARLVRRLWIPVDILGLIGVISFGQSPVFMDWVIIAGIAPRVILELLALGRLLPATFFGNKITAGLVGVELLVLTYLATLGLGVPILWAAPLVTLVVLWRLTQKTGGLVKTLVMLNQTASAMSAAEAAKTAGAAAAPVRMRAVSRSSLEAAATLSPASPVLAPQTPEEDHERPV